MSDQDKSRSGIEGCGCGFCGEPLPERMQVADRSGVSRRGLLLGGTGLIGAGLLGGGMAAPRRAAAQASGGLPERGEFVIRDGVVVTVDDSIGTLYGADVHVRDGEIIAIGEDLDVPAGTEEIDASRRIVMPGLIDTHFHIWTSLMRNMLNPGNEYFAIKRAFVPNMTPDAFYASDMLAFAESINAGVTTLHNYDHHCMNRDTVEAEMRAHADSGVRSLFTFGHPDGLPAEQTIDLDLAESIRTEYFGAASPFEGLVTMGIHTRG
ncbi:MAG: amidohydrolase family protein, partial [Rhodobacteraceae bacterium]|nr:amidohydrolase family protein [Paracoccaceae bacterium]